MSYRKSRSRKERRRSSLNSASFLLTQMFEWSRFRIDVRTFVDQQVSVIPTIIRIVDPVEKFEFYAGTLYLIRSVFSQLLVVARTEDNKYLAIPMTSQLKFHLINDNNQNCTPASDAMTLADMLSNANIIYFKGHRVRCANPITVANTVFKGELLLVDMYNEKYLLGYAFTGATLTPDVKVIPGYINLTIDIARSMNGGSVDNFHTYVNQLVAVTEMFPQKPNVADFLEEIAVFGERPNVNYELNDVRSALEWHRQSSLYTNTSPASTSSYCSCTSQMSSPDSSLYQTPKGSRMKLRPLPPIPVVERAISTTSSPATYQVEPDYDKPTSQEKLDERMTNVLKTRKKTVTVTKSLPTMHRTHSVPFLADDDNSLGQTRPARLSSQSLEDVSQQLASSSEDDLDDSPWTQPAEISDGATSSIKIIRPPLPPKPSAEQIVNAFRSKGSMLRRQRPVARSRGGIDAYRSLQFNQQTYTVSTQSESSVLATVSIKRHSAEMYDENIYEQIKSPIYCDMSSLSRRTSPRSGESTNTFCWQPKAAGIATVVTSSLANDESIYECYQPRLQPADSELYVNVDALRNAASNNSTICTPTTLTVSDSRSGIVKPLIRHVNSGLNDSEGIYCSPISQSLTGDKTIEHDVPDAVTRSSQNGAPVISDRQLDSATGSESGDRELRWLSIDEIPTDVTSFTVDDVASCLRLLNLGGYVALFRREQIDGDLLTSLDKDVLMEDFGFKRFDAIKLEKFVRHGWRPKLV